MSMQLAQVNRALGKPVGTPWPETFTPKQIAHFAVWRGDEPDPHWSARAAPLTDLLTLACQRGELTCTTITERVPDPNWPVRPRIIAKGYSPYGQPIQRDRPPPRPTVEVTRYSIAAAPLAAWLDAQRVPPGELLQAWFKSQGVGVAAVEVGPPEPAAQPEAVLMTSPAPHKRQKRDLLTPLIDRAVIACDGRTDPAEVFGLLRQWAKEEPPRQPLFGSTGGTIQWLSATDKPNELTLDALSKRLKPAAKRG